MALPYTEYLQLIADLINSPEVVKLLIHFGVIKKCFRLTKHFSNVE
jgi:hypothetical protein